MPGGKAGRTIVQAKAKAINAEQSPAINAAQSAAITLAQRGQRHAEEMAKVSEKVVPHVQAMAPGEILDRIQDVEKFDRMARRNYGLDVQLPLPHL